ncbi:soluble guanylate cyclase gcy-31-like [Babylonia areolata]|uniref:soluble guanylate cyclase gcy-31-like n=1 Tax=Babylonia areolata TaxID=304850 RepID=UPI003FCF2C58
MYGLLVEAIADYIKVEYGEEVWQEICQVAQVGPTCFSTHEIYGEDVIPNIAQGAAEVLDQKVDDIMDNFGVAFVSFVGQYGYDNILKVLGRNLRDFLNGLDNLHEYLRFSYPKLKPPSFFVDNENRSGLTLHYRSRRRGFLHYVKGQIRRVGELFYNTKINIYVVDEVEHPEDGTIHVKFRLLFDNIAFRDANRKTADGIVDNIPLRSELLLELFPFHLVFGRKLEIRSAGVALLAVMPDVVGRLLPDIFSLTRPLTKLSWEEVLAHTNNVFEMVSRRLLKPDPRGDDERSVTPERSGKDPATSENLENLEDFTNRLRVKGQMLFMSEWETIMFLGTPVMNSLDDMFNSGLYINDLSMHDSSRDLVLAGTQQSAELKLALDQEQEKSRLLGESMKKLDAEMKRTDALLYQMIPKPVADRLRRGEPSVATCQAFDSVTILFSDVVGFTTICSRITPMEVVSMLNAMYTEFDQLSEKHDVYKVETIGDAYMAVAGAPTVTRFHAINMCNMALDMLLAMTSLRDPSSQDTMRIRVGIHSGATVAGVVGLKMPRYCLFGDTVNTASRMETSGEAMKIHISETTRQELIGYPYAVQERGEVEVKGKGAMKTYWLLGHEEDPAKAGPTCPFAQLMEMERQKHAQDRASVAAVSHRPVYSPVSFEDLNADQKLSPGATPQPSPARLQQHGTTGKLRRASLASGCGGGGHSVREASEGHAVNSTSSSGSISKPTQAVPPTRSGSCSPTFFNRAAPEGGGGAGEKSPPPSYTSSKPPSYGQGNGVQQSLPQHPNLTNNHNNNHHDTVQGETILVPQGTVAQTRSPLPHRPQNNKGSGTSSADRDRDRGGHFVKVTGGVIKCPPEHDDGNPADQSAVLKESRTEKGKSKTCAVL